MSQRESSTRLRECRGLFARASSGGLYAYNIYDTLKGQFVKQSATTELSILQELRVAKPYSIEEYVFQLVLEIFGKRLHFDDICRCREKSHLMVTTYVVAFSEEGLHMLSKTNTDLFFQLCLQNHFLQDMVNAG